MLINESVGVLLQDLGLAAYSLGHEVFIVGGYVRNKLHSQIYSKPSSSICDIDLVINTNAIEFIERYQPYLEDNDREHLTFEIIESFPAFGTVRIRHPRYPQYRIELASTRLEFYDRGVIFPRVEFINNVQLDLPRRDFTMNALLISLMPSKFLKHNYGDVLDYVSGIDDLKKGLIRAFHQDSFMDDPTRILRAVRFKFEYDFDIEEKTLSWILNTVQDPIYLESSKKKSKRFELEMSKILNLENSQKAVDYLKSLES